MIKTLRYLVWSLLAWVLLSPVPSLAQSVLVEATLQPDTVEEGSPVVYTLQIQGTNQAPDEPPDLSRIPDFVLASGPSVSSSFQWINGRTQSSRSYRYTLLPRGTGKKSIAPIEVKLGGRIYQTQPQTVEVIPRGQGGASDPQAPAPDSPFARPNLKNRLARPPRERGNIFVEARTNKNEVYPGEQVTLEYFVFTQREIAQLSLKDQPTYPGFWVEDLKTDGEYNARTVKRDGETFTQYTILKKALFPTKPGVVEIAPLAFHFAVRARGQSPFDSFFFQPTESVYRTSQPLTIRVTPYPEEGKPPEFDGAVGRFTLSVKADRRETKVNDALALKVVIEGQGNLSTVAEPKLPELPDIKRYEPKVEESIRAKADQLVGEKSWDYVLIPLAAGNQVIPPVRFAFLDPSTHEYRVLESDPIPLQVAKTDLASLSVPTPPDRSEIAVLGSDIRYIKPARERLRGESRLFLGSVPFLALLGAPILANVGLFLWSRRRVARAGNEKQFRRRRANRKARQRLKRARSHLAHGRAQAFYQETAVALTTYLADKAGVTPSGLTYDRIDQFLEDRGVDAEARQRFRLCLETCDYARFAPQSAERAEMDRAYSEARSVIETLEGMVRIQ